MLEVFRSVVGVVWFWLSGCILCPSCCCVKQRLDVVEGVKSGDVEEASACTKCAWMSFIWGNFIIEGILLAMATRIHAQLAGATLSYYGMVVISVLGMLLSMNDFCNAAYKKDTASPQVQQELPPSARSLNNNNT